MAKIHNGFFDKKFHDTFKDSNINETDIATTKFYKRPKYLYEHLGFVGIIHDKPDEQRYWKNIIPKDYDLSNRQGVTLVDGRDPMIGSKTPRESYQEYFVDENASQTWDNNYYYPSLPKLNKYGVIGDGEPIGELYGAKETWDGDDVVAPITNKNDNDDDLIMNIDFNQTDTDGLEETIGNFNIQYNTDYSLMFDNNFRIEKKGFDIPDSLELDEDEQAF